MDEEIQLTVKTVTGQTSIVNVKRSETVRSLLKSANISFPTGSFPSFFHDGKLLNPDLSFLVQNVRNHDLIVALVHKVPQQQNYPSHYVSSQERQRVLFEEALRVSDVSFILVDSCDKCLNIYNSYIESSDESLAEDEDYIDEFSNENQKSVIAGSTEVRVDPLPVCWNSDDYENEQESNKKPDTNIIQILHNRRCSGAIADPNCGNEL